MSSCAFEGAAATSEKVPGSTSRVSSISAVGACTIRGPGAGGGGGGAAATGGGGGAALIVGAGFAVTAGAGLSSPSILFLSERSVSREIALSVSKTPWPRTAHAS